MIYIIDFFEDHEDTDIPRNKGRGKTLNVLEARRK